MSAETLAPTIDSAQTLDPVEPASRAGSASLEGELADVMWALHDLASASAEYDAHLAGQLGVSATELIALKHLLVERGDHELGAVELGRLLGMSSGSATTLLHRLEAQGHVHRQPHPTDRRRRRLTVEPDTVARVVDALNPASAAIARISRTLTPDQGRAVVAFLRQVATEYRRNATPPMPTPTRPSIGKPHDTARA